MILEAPCKNLICPSATASPFSRHDDKVLNQRTESKYDSVIANQSAAKNKFIFRLRFTATATRFQSAASRYADK
jgi:hypothetical protein